MEELYKEYSKLVYNYLYTLCHDTNLAEELTQETFYKAIKYINKFDYKCKISTWLCTIAKNSWIDYIRNFKNDISFDDKIFDDLLISNTFENYISDKIDAKTVYKIIDGFEPIIKDLFHLRLDCNLNFKEIGKVLGKSENWARLAFYRWKIKIREVMKDGEN